MSRRSDYDNWYPPYVPVAERRARAAKAAKRLAREMDIQPIAITGRTLARSWWGKAWNANLERYSDYSNRLPRGRSYVRHGSVIHLDIQPGRVKALIHGSGSNPYEVEIEIAALDDAVWQQMITACAETIESARDLLAGKFPKDLASLFTEQGSGLFPAPEEITFQCSCPDWALMCKHVAATLYGVGARLDQTPALFFTLRQVNLEDLVGQAVQGVAETLSRKAENVSDRVLKGEDLGSVFGITMDGIDFDLPDPGPEYAAGEFIGEVNAPESLPPAVPEKKQKETTEKAKAKANNRKKAAGRRTSKKARRPRKSRTKTKAAPQASGSIMDQLLAVLAEYPDGATAFELMDATGWTESRVRNTIARGKSRGAIISCRRGHYILAASR